jgi:glucans biosynthesis protein C
MGGKEMSNKNHTFYIDNIKIFLTSLVVLHHHAITYGGPGGWYYNESTDKIPEIIPLSMFLATNQAFFMGLFFYISAYFVCPSLIKKGARKFAKERLIRLGIPTLLFFFLLSPLTIFIRNKYILGESVSISDYIFRSRAWGFGPMWFVEALLIFTFVYLLIKKMRPQIGAKYIEFPRTAIIILFASVIGVGQFLIRMMFPVGWSIPFMNLQIAHFLQYISLFALGTIAYEKKWLDKITFKMGWIWFVFVQVLIFVGFPILFVGGGAASGEINKFMGGPTWQSFVYAVWEQLVGFGLAIALIGIFKQRFNKQSIPVQKLSASAYGVYVFHPPVLLFSSAIFLHFNIPQFWKFIVLAPVVLIMCFAVGYLVKILPIVRKIF